MSLSPEEERKNVEDRFKRIVETNLDQTPSRGFLTMIIIVLVVSLVVGGTYYYIKRKPKGEKDAKGGTSRKSESAGESGKKVIIASE